MIKNIFTKFILRNKEKVAMNKLLAINLKPSDIVIDCGANVGDITSCLCKSGATVYAFEPNPFAFKVLTKRFEYNENVHCIQKGVLDRDCTMNLYLHEFAEQDMVHWSTGSSLLDFKSNIQKDKYVEVDVIDICSFILTLKSQIKLLKIDVEGVECSILRKIILTGLNEKIDNIFVETHDHKIPELKLETDNIRKQINDEKIMLCQ